MAGASSLGGSAAEGTKAGATKHPGPTVGQGSQRAQHILGKAKQLRKLHRKGRGRLETDAPGIREANSGRGLKTKRPGGLKAERARCLEAERSWSLKAKGPGSLKADGTRGGEADLAGDAKIQAAQASEDRIKAGLLGIAQAAKQVAIE